MLGTPPRFTLPFYPVWPRLTECLHLWLVWLVSDINVKQRSPILLLLGIIRYYQVLLGIIGCVIINQSAALNPTTRLALETPLQQTYSQPCSLNIFTDCKPLISRSSLSFYIVCCTLSGLYSSHAHPTPIVETLLFAIEAAFGHQTSHSNTVMTLSLSIFRFTRSQHRNPKQDHDSHDSSSVTTETGDASPPRQPSPTSPPGPDLSETRKWLILLSIVLLVISIIFLILVRSNYPKLSYHTLMYVSRSSQHKQASGPWSPPPGSSAST